MKPTSAVLLAFAILLGGCAGEIPVDREAATYLGAGAVHVLSAPTKIEGWNFQRADGTIANDPPIRPLDISIARQVGEILLNQDTYRSPSGGGGFSHDVGYRIWRGDETVDVLISFGNDQMQLKYRAYNGQPSSSFASIASGRDKLIRVAREAYPDFKAPAREGLKRQTRHIPVLLDEVLAALAPRAGAVIVDCTLGLGGHSAALLERLGPEGKMIGIDFDPANIEIARARLTEVGERGGKFELYHNNFAALPTVLAQAGVERVDGVLADLGVASPQIDDPARGFSYRKPGPLDMRMDPTRGQPASALIAKMSERELAAALLELGDETDAAEIARLVVERRQRRPIETTQELMAIVCEARDFTIERGAGAKLHPAARTFQALRILVNRELANLERLLAVLPDCLKPGGIAAIISFHSGEDRRVKGAFMEGLRGGIYTQISREPIIADEAEERANPRARSAKLRWARRGGR